MTNAIQLQPKERFEGIPQGYICNSKGVQQLGDDKNDPITTKPVTVKAGTRDHEGNNWGVLVWWLDQDDRAHEIAIPKRMFHAQGTELAQRLADGGLPIMPGKERKLLTYLALFNIRQRLVAASSTGWLGNAFVLPNETINEPAGERIVYQPAGLSSHARAMRRGGTLEQWQVGISDASPMVRFLICASLSAPVRYQVGVEAGGFHIYDETSRGKTTALQAAASCWGSGVDPQRAGGGETYISRWNATANALEAKAELHNDLPMVVDEIGEGDTREFGRTIYRIISGTGRDRSKETGSLRDSKSWRVSILSAGELAVSDFIEQGGGKAKGGQLVRMIDINLDHAPALFADGDQADAMKEHCASHYGHAGPEFLKRVPDLAAGWKEMDKSLIGPAITPIAVRALKRFGLVLHTGRLAAGAGILPWTEGQVLESVRLAYSIWLDQVSTVSDTDRGISAVANFVLAQESRFETGFETQPPRDRAGWKRDQLYHFTLSAFKEVCAGANPTKVKRALLDAGLLHTSKGLNSVIRVEGHNVTVVSVKAAILSSLAEPAGSAGNARSSPGTTGDATATASDEQAVAVGSAQSPSAQSATGVTTAETEVVAAESRDAAGPLPPLPLLPVENGECSGKTWEQF